MTTKKKRRGLKPSSDRLAEMHEEGYGTPAEVARAVGVSASAVYTWIGNEALKPIGEKVASKKVGANVWVLYGAAAIKAGIGCVHCGCTELRACHGGCSWASQDPPICSRCVGKRKAA
jgi:hypothetical protein